MKIDFQVMTNLLTTSEDLKGKLADSVYKQNETLSTIVQNVGSSSFAYESAVLANNIESVTIEQIQMLDNIIVFLNKQLKRYIENTSGAKSELSKLSEQIGQAISAVSNSKIK